MSTARPPGDTTSLGGGRRRVLNHSQSSGNVVKASTTINSPTLTHKPVSTGVIRAKVDINALNPPVTSRNSWTTNSSSPNTVNASTTTTPRVTKPSTRVTPQSTPFVRSNSTVSTPLQQLQQRPASPVRRGAGARSPQLRPSSSASSTPSGTPDLRGQHDQFPTDSPLVTHLPSSVSLRAIHSPSSSSLKASTARSGAHSPPATAHNPAAQTLVASKSSAAPAARYSSASSSSAGTNRSTPLTSPNLESQRFKIQHMSNDSSPSTARAPMAVGGKSIRRPPLSGSSTSSATTTPTLSNTRPPRRRVSSESGSVAFAPLPSPSPSLSPSIYPSTGGALLPPLTLVGSTSSPTLRSAGQRPPIWSPTLLQHAQQSNSLTGARESSSDRSPSVTSGTSSSSYEDRAGAWSKSSVGSATLAYGPDRSSMTGDIHGRARTGADGSSSGRGRPTSGTSEYERREIVLGSVDWSVEADRLENEMRAERERDEELEKASIEAERAKKEAQRQRKILDLEISNTSLLTINASLERIKSLQTKEIRDLRRRLRESNVGANFGSSGMLSGSSKARRELAAFRASEGLALDDSFDDDESERNSDFGDDDDDDNEPEQTWDEILQSDSQFSAIAHAVERLVRNGQEAVEYVVDRKALDGVGGRVLDVVEMEERQRSNVDDDDDDDDQDDAAEEADGLVDEIDSDSRDTDSGSDSAQESMSGSSSGSGTASASPVHSDSEEDNDRTRTQGLGIRYSLD